MITLRETPHLVWPTTDVRMSYLTGEQADCLLRGTDTAWLGAAREDFDSFVAQRRGVRTRWGVPSTLFWYVAEDPVAVYRSEELTGCRRTNHQG
jgi:hypothetical protein